MPPSFVTLYNFAPVAAIYAYPLHSLW